MMNWASYLLATVGEQLVELSRDVNVRKSHPC